jgi:hypothetical protein
MHSAPGPCKASFLGIEVEDVTWCLDPIDAAAKGQDGARGAAGAGTRSFQAPIFNREQIRMRVISRKQPDGEPLGDRRRLENDRRHLAKTEVEVWFFGRGGTVSASVTGTCFRVQGSGFRVSASVTDGGYESFIAPFFVSLFPPRPSPPSSPPFVISQPRPISRIATVFPLNP